MFPKAIMSVGIDVAKHKFDVAFLAHDQTVQLFTFPNTAAGITDCITALNTQGTAATVPCVLESTAMYHLRIALMLTSAGFCVNCINPLITKKYQRASIRKAKTDRVDALRLAQIGLIEPGLRRFDADAARIGRKKLIAFLSKLETLKQQLKASLRDLKETLLVLDDMQSTSDIDTALDGITAEIRRIEQYLLATAPAAAHALARTTKGISGEKAAVIFSLLEGKEFTHRDQLVAYVGLDVSPRQSGTWVGRGKLSKRGNAYLRKVLYQVAWGLKQHNSRFRSCFDTLRASGKCYRVALIILARKFLRFLYAYYWKDGGNPQYAL